MAFSGIIFDIDGTLYAMNQRVRVSMLLNTIPRCRHFFKYIKIRHLQQAKDFENAQNLRSHINSELKKQGVPDDYEEKVFYPAFTKALSKNRNRPELIEFIKYCKTIGLKTAVFSDFGIIDERLKALGYDLDLFDVRIASEDLGAFKPTQRIFLEVANRMGLKPQNILMVGDRDDTDGLGAKSVGMSFFKLNGKNNYGFINAVKTLRSLFINSMPISIKRLPHNTDLPAPQRATIFSAGADLTAANSVPILIEPGQRVLVPTGLIFEIPVGYEVQIRSRSGLAFKHGIVVLNSPGTIDSDYRGEVFVLLANQSNEPFTINRGERIAQAILAKVYNCNFYEKANLSKTARGAGGFGSTGR